MFLFVEEGNIGGGKKRGKNGRGKMEGRKVKRIYERSGDKNVRK